MRVSMAAPAAAAKINSRRVVMVDLPCGLIRLWSTAIEVAEVLIAELEQRRRDVLLEVLDARRAGDGEHHGGVPEQPRERHLRGRRVQAPGDARHRAARLREIAREQREPRDEGDALALAMLEDLLRRLRLGHRVALDEVVPVLHRDDRHELASPLDVRHGNLRQPDVTDLPLLLQIPQGTELIVERHGGIDAVELVQLDALELEPAQAGFTGGAQVFRSTVRRPLTWAGTLESPLGGDHQLWRIRIKGLRDEALAHRRAVGVGRVDQIDAELERQSQHGDRLGVVARLAPDSLAREPHRAEAEAIHRAIAAQEEAAALRHRDID